MRIILASASPRRVELLNQAGIDVDVLPASIDETMLEGVHPKEEILRLANEKNQAVFAQYPNACVISADTMVVLDDVAYNKPNDEADAFRMLKDLNGKTHQVMTACVIQAPHFKEVILSITHVHMTSLTDEDIFAYIESKEPMDKAGAYAIQGRAGWMIERIEGDFYTVVGLPLNQCVKILREKQIIDLKKV